MIFINHLKGILFLFLLLFTLPNLDAQQALNWSADGSSYYQIEEGDIVQYTLPSGQSKILISKAQLTPPGEAPLEIYLFDFSENGQKLLIYTNATRVWRINTRGNYYVLDVTSGALKKLGIGRANASLMFAKFSPDGSKV